MLDDGTYDVNVVDAEVLEPGIGEQDGPIRVEVTVLDGPHKGEVVSVIAAGLGREAYQLLGLPGTLTVSDGTPALAIEG